MKRITMRTAAKRIYQRIFGVWMNQYPRSLHRATQSCASLLDVGCGACSPLQDGAWRIRYSVGVDAWQPAIDHSKALGLHDEYVCCAVSELREHFAPRSFDCVAATDLIEHLPHEDGLRLLDDMEALARKRVIIITPNGFLPQEPYDGNEFQRHLSGWTAQEMRARGYRVFGINGWRPLRGERSLIRLHPRRFWEPISLISQPFVHHRPHLAFQLLCVKYLRP